MNLRLLLHQQVLSVRQLAFELEVPLKTVQDWVYRGVVPSPANQAKLDEVVVCTHHWVIETSSGPVSSGRCRLCGEEREFNNSTEYHAGGKGTAHAARFDVGQPAAISLHSSGAPPELDPPSAPGSQRRD